MVVCFHSWRNKWFLGVNQQPCVNNSQLHLMGFKPQRRGASSCAIRLLYNIVRCWDHHKLYQLRLPSVQSFRLVVRRLLVPIRGRAISMAVSKAVSKALKKGSALRVWTQDQLALCQDNVTGWCIHVLCLRYSVSLVGSTYSWNPSVIASYAWRRHRRDMKYCSKWGKHQSHTRTHIHYKVYMCLSLSRVSV